MERDFEMKGGRSSRHLATRLTSKSAQVSEVFRTKTSSGGTWHSHYLCPMEVRNATGASSSLISEILVLHASPELRPVLASQYDKERTDYGVHALVKTQWEQTYEDNERRLVKPVSRRSR